MRGARDPVRPSLGYRLGLIRWYRSARRDRAAAAIPVGAASPGIGHRRRLSPRPVRSDVGYRVRGLLMAVRLGKPGAWGAAPPIQDRILSLRAWGSYRIALR